VSGNGSVILGILTIVLFLGFLFARNITINITNNFKKEESDSK